MDFVAKCDILFGMDCILFEDVTFAYPADQDVLDDNEKPIVPAPVFEHFTGAIPAGFTSLVGPNGSGKSTFLMLASGRLVPQQGRCRLFGQDVAALCEEQRNLLASVIYQNMEFESSQKVSELLYYVYANGALNGSATGIAGASDLCAELISTLELESVLEHRLTHLSKGEIQRVLLAFSLLYGSPALFMDEPLFAMEERQKNVALDYLRAYAAKTGTAMFFSMHELELTRRFAQKVLLFYPNRDIDYGTPEEVLTNEALEKAYGVPATLLKHQEDMTREELQQTAAAILKMQTMQHT